MNQAQKKNARYHVAPVLVLIILAPTIAEILLGDVLLNASFVPTLLMYLLLYGSGALLVREVARRLHLGWPGIIVLALAYGVVEEGLILQTFFNQHFLPGFEMLAAYGRALGTSWFWMVCVLAMHGVWSITLPILLTERLFPTLASRSWLGRVGLSLDAIIYVLTVLVMFRFFTAFLHFSASPLALLLAALAVMVLVVLALVVAPRWVAVSDAKDVPAPFMVGLVALVAGVLFFAIRLFFPAVPAVPPLLPILLYAGLYAGMGLLVWRWATAAGWTDQHQLALVSGLLLTYMLYGFRLSARGSLADLIFHAVVCGVFIWLLAWMVSRHAQVSSVSQRG